MPTFKLHARNDLKRLDRKGMRWEILGMDPFFLLEGPGREPLPAGRYWIKAGAGRHVDELRGGSMYLDTGDGFTEADKQPVSFIRTESGQCVGVITLPKPVFHLRYDPSDTDFGKVFELETLEIEPVLQTARIHPEGTPRLLINLVRLLPSGGGAGGAGRFALALLEYLPAVMEVRCAIPPHHTGLSVQFPEVDFVVCTADENEQLGKHIAWCDCYLDPLNALRPKTIDPDVPAIGIVLDLQHMEMPWLFSEEELAARRREYRYAISRSDHLIAISDYERRNLEIFYGRRDVTVAHLSGFMAEAIEHARARSSLASPTGAKGGQKPYLIYPAVPWAHKNHEALIQAIAILKQRKIKVPLVLTNTSGNSQGSKRVAEIIQRLDVADVVDRKAFLPEAELHSLFEGATGLVFPSLYEGFGIPLVDAMKMNIPVLAARTSAAEEIGQEACAYFSNVRNVLAMARDIEAFWNDASGRAALVESGKVRGADFQTRKMVACIASAVNAAIAAKSSRTTQPAPTIEIEGPRFNDLHVMVIINEDDADLLRKLPDNQDINVYLEGLAGTKHITVAIDIALAADPVLCARLETVNNLIVYDPSRPHAVDFIVTDFELRYNTGRLSMVTTLGRLASELHLNIRSMYDLLNLHGHASATRIDKTLTDAKLLAVPDEVDGILQYERLRRGHLAVLDVMFNRSLMGGKKNGTSAFLAHYARHSHVVLAPAREG